MQKTGVWNTGLNITGVQAVFQDSQGEHVNWGEGQGWGPWAHKGKGRSWSCQSEENVAGALVMDEHRF